MIRACEIEPSTGAARLARGLMESGEAPDEVVLTEEETGTLFLVLKTTVDVLDEAARSGHNR